MTTIRALFSFMQGEEAYQSQGLRRFPCGVPAIRLYYLDGHPSIGPQQSLWVGRVGGWLRLVGDHGELPYNIAIGRIRGVAYDPEGFVRLRFELTAGLVATAVFRVDHNGAANYQRLVHMVALSA